jgi:hypothetical protein
MAENESKEPPTPPPTPPKRARLPLPEPQDVEAYFEEKGIRPTCPMCGTTKWFVWGEAGSYVAVVQNTLQPDGSSHQGHVRLLTLSCQKCSFVRQHLYNFFVDWLEARKKPEDAPK